MKAFPVLSGSVLLLLLVAAILEHFQQILRNAANPFPSQVPFPLPLLSCAYLSHQL